MKRSDAKKNRHDLLEAARAVFAEHGVLAPLDLIRHRADVGRATLYRHFPDRQSLLLALMDERLERLSREEGDFRTLLRKAALEVSRDEAVQIMWGERQLSDEEARIRRARLVKVFDAPLLAAQAAGEVIEDISTDQITLILRMISGAAQTSGSQDRQTAALSALALVEKALCKPSAPSSEPWS